MKDFIEPILIKAGDDRVLLGQFKQPPKVDCRVISEDQYQKLVKESDSLPCVIETLKSKIDGLSEKDRKQLDKVKLVRFNSR